MWRPGSADPDGSANRWALSHRARLIAAIVAALMVVGALSAWFATERAAAARKNRQAVLCEVADVIVATPSYPELEKFLAVEWRFLTGTAAGTHDAAFSKLVAGLPPRPDPAAVKPVAAYCHAHGMGIVTN